MRSLIIVSILSCCLSCVSVSTSIAGFVASSDTTCTVVLQPAPDNSSISITYKLPKSFKRNAAFNLSRIQSSSLSFGTVLLQTLPQFAGINLVVQTQYMGRAQKTILATPAVPEELELLRRIGQLLIIVSRHESQSEYDDSPITDTIAFFVSHNGKPEVFKLSDEYLNFFLQLLCAQYWTISNSPTEVILQLFKGPLGCTAQELEVITNMRIQEK